MLLKLREAPRARGPGYQVAALGGSHAVSFYRQRFTMLYVVDDTRRRIVVGAILYLGPNRLLVES